MTKVPPLLSDFNDIRLNAAFFLRLKRYEQKSRLEPQPEQTTLLDENIKAFLEMGESGGRQKIKLREIDKKLSKQVYSLAKTY
jgi:hypothetical protein